MIMPKMFNKSAFHSGFCLLWLFFSVETNICLVCTVRKGLPIKYTIGSLTGLILQA